MAIFDLMADPPRARRSARDWVVDSLVFVVAVVSGLILYDQGMKDNVSGFVLTADFYCGMALCLTLWFRRRCRVARRSDGQVGVQFVQGS